MKVYEQSIATTQVPYLHLGYLAVSWTKPDPIPFGIGNLSLVLGVVAVMVGIIGRVAISQKKFGKMGLAACLIVGACLTMSGAWLRMESQYEVEDMSYEARLRKTKVYANVVCS